MTPNQGKRKYSVTMYETLIHSFTVEADNLNDVADAAEEAFTQAPLIEELPGYSLLVRDREVEDAQPV